MSSSNEFQAPRFLKRRANHWHYGRKRRVGPPGQPNTAIAEPVKCPTLEDIADPGFLLRVFHDRKSWAGKATGNDGIRWSDIGRSEAASVFRQISIEILHGTYRPSVERRVMIPRKGKKPRPIAIGSVIDRVVAAAAALLLNKYYETFFYWGSYAYREERGHLDMLALLAVIVEKEHRWVIGNHDIRQAFVNIPLGAVMDAHRAVINDVKLLQFIEALVYGADGAGKELELSQGAPYSPVAMNLLMHTILDSVYERDPNDSPLLRFSDNLVTLNRSVADSMGTRARCQGLLDPYRLALKEDTDPEERIHADLLAGERTRLLGFTLGYHDGRMTFDIDAKWWEKLSSSLHECHRYPDSPHRTYQVIDGWILATGPAASRWRVDSYVSRTLDTLHSTGFRETDPETVRALWVKSADLWEHTLLEALQDYPLVRSASATANAPEIPS